MNGIVNAHKAEFDAEPEVVVEVPQVTTLLGAFADFCKGYSLMSTNTQGLRVAISRRSDQMVIAFHSTKVSAAHPKVAHQPRREASARSLIHSRGTNAASSGSPDRPSHPAESRMAERMAAASFRDMEIGMGIFTNAKVVKPRQKTKIFHYFCVEPKHCEL